MKHNLFLAMLIAALLLTACSSTPSQGRSPETPPSPVQPAPVQTPDQPDPVPAPPPKPPSGGANEPAPAQPTLPVVTWMPRGIGLPLAPSDPANEQKVILLTFDDGPSEFTVPILETLAKEEIKVIFFITGYGARNHPELVERIHREGHTLAVHTMTHPNMRRLSREEQLQEIQPLVELIERVSGQKPRYFRPPFGAYNQTLLDLLEELDMELINWTNGSLDWQGVVDGRKDHNQVVSDVMRQLHRGAVVLFHDTMQHTADALPEVIRQIRAEGYEFVTLP